jgi:hypothetical protein
MLATTNLAVDAYQVFGEQLESRTEPGPDKTITATIETLDTDRAFAGLTGCGLPLP